MDSKIKDFDHICMLKDCIISSIMPIKIYLFGSFAEGNSRPESDYDFYVVVADDAINISDITKKAYRSMRGKKNRPVDLVVVRESKFEERKSWKLSLEREVADKGVLLYAA